MILENGTRIYYRGDGANELYFATIINFKNDRFYEIKLDTGQIKLLPFYCLSEKYENNGTTPFVTEKSYFDWREKATAELKKYINKK